MTFPVFDLDSPTLLAFSWGWLLVTVANLVMLLLLGGVFVLGATVRVRGVRKDLAAVEAERPLAPQPERTGMTG
jgi:hypothetical protein